MVELSCVFYGNVCFVPPQKEQKHHCTSRIRRLSAWLSLANENRFLTCVVNVCLVASHQCSSLLAHPDTRLGAAHKGGHSTALHLREKLPIGADALALRVLSMELAHLRLNFLLIWSLPDAFSEQGHGNVPRNRRRSKATRMSGSDFCLRSLVFEMGRQSLL